MNMTYELDAGLLQAITARFTSGAGRPPSAPRDDWKTCRANSEAGLTALEAALPEHPEVSRVGYQAVSHDGAGVTLRW
jgi:hypothetical protein